MLQIRPSSRQHWRISVRPTATLRIIWRTINSCHVSIASGDTLLHVSVWCKSRPRRVFLKVPEELEITGTHTAKRPCDWLRCYGWKIMDHAAYSPDLATSTFHYFGPLKTELLASDLQQTLKWSKLSPPGYRHLTQTSDMSGNKLWCTKWLMLQC